MTTPPASASVIRRALLYVPASSQRMLTKSLSLDADNITYDLEDAVTPHEKPNARRALAAHLASLPAGRRPPGVREVAARINAVSTPHALADLEALGPAAAAGALDAVVVPKVDRPGDLTFVADVLRHLAPARGPGVRLIALVESARAVVDLDRICAAAAPAAGPGRPRLAGLVFAAEDFARDLSVARTPSLREFLYARSAVAAHARAHDLESTIDLVCTYFRGAGGAAGDDEATRRLLEECADGRGLGFNGKQCIHPSQVATVQRAFAPAADEVEWSVRVVVADEKASRGGGGGGGGGGDAAAAGVGRGAWTLDGKMIDAPVVGRARALLERARMCGFDVEGLRERWKGQEPE